MSRVKAIGVSILDTTVFASYTVLPAMVFLWAVGFIQINL